MPCGVLGTEQTTIAEVLSEHGYFTFASIGISVVKAVKDFLQGFQAYSSSSDGKAASDINRFVLANLKKKHEKVFAYIHYCELHSPYGDLNPMEEPYFSPVMRDEQSLSEAQHAALVEAYCEEIRTVDRGVAEVIRYLKDHDLYDSALVVLVSDHGESFGESNYLRHGVLLEEHLVHVPCLVKYPHSARTGENLEYLQLSDIPFLILEGADFRHRRTTIEISVQPNPFAADVAPKRFNRAMYLTIEPKPAATTKTPESSQAFILKSLGYLR